MEDVDELADDVDEAAFEDVDDPLESLPAEPADPVEVLVEEVLAASPDGEEGVVEVAEDFPELRESVR